MNPKSRSFVLLLSALTALTSLSIDMSLPALPLLQARFHSADGVVQLTLSLFLVGYTVGQLTCGPLSDRYGRRPLLLLGVGLYVLASLGCAFAPSLPVLIALRFIQGVGGSFGPILARAMVRDCFEKKDAVQVLSQITQVMVIAPLVAPTIGGLLLVRFGWQSIFVFLTVSGALLLLMSWLAIGETRPPLASVDDVPPFWGGLHHVAAEPVTLSTAVMVFFVSAGMFAYISASPFVVIDIFQVPKERFGLVFALSAAALLAGASGNRLFLHRFGSPRLLRWGVGCVAGSGVAMLACVAGQVGGLAGVVVPMMVYIFGVGLLMPNAIAAAMEPHGRLAGMASSFLGSVQTLGSALAGYVVGLFYNRTPLPMAIAVAAAGLLTLAVAVLRSGRTAAAASVATAEEVALEEEFVE